MFLSFLQQPKALSRNAPASFLLCCRSDFSFFSLSGSRVCVCVCICECIHTHDRVYISRICIPWRWLAWCVNPPPLYSSRKCCLCRTSFSTAAVFKKHRFFLVFIRTSPNEFSLRVLCSDVLNAIK